MTGSIHENRLGDNFNQKVENQIYSSSNVTEYEFIPGLMNVEEKAIFNNIKTYERDAKFLKENDIKQIGIRLVEDHFLWGHHLYNAAIVAASFFDQYPELVQHKTVLELGAGGGLPSLIVAMHQPLKVVITDYPDKELIENIQYNVDQNLKNIIPDDIVKTKGFAWGKATDELRSLLPTKHTTYDVIILCDLLFDNSQHCALLKTCLDLLTPKTGRVYIFFTNHRPAFSHLNLEFFKIAQWPVPVETKDKNSNAYGYGFKAEHIHTKYILAEDDPNYDDERFMVHSWQMWLP